VTSTHGVVDRIWWVIISNSLDAFIAFVFYNIFQGFSSPVS